MSRVATFTLTYWNSGYMEPGTRGGTLVEVDGMLLAESAAIVEFILARYGHGRLQHGPDHPDFASYLYWFHLDRKSTV